MHVFYRNGRSIQWTVYNLIIKWFGEKLDDLVTFKLMVLVGNWYMSTRLPVNAQETSKSIRCVSTIWETISYEPPPMARIIWFYGLQNINYVTLSKKLRFLIILSTIWARGIWYGCIILKKRKTQVANALTVSLQVFVFSTSEVYAAYYAVHRLCRRSWNSFWLKIWNYWTDCDHFIVQNRESLYNSMIKSTGYVTNLPYGAVGIYEIHVSSSWKTLE